jgi:hypothetical protein
MRLMGALSFKIVPGRIVDDDGPAVGEGLDRMADITWDDCNQARSRDLSQAVDGHFELALNHLVDLFLRMEVLVNGRAALEFVVREMSCSTSGNSVHTSPATVP